MMLSKKLARRTWLLQGAIFVSMGLLTVGGPGAEAARSQSQGISARAFQQQIGQPGAFIRVTWNRPKAVPSSLVRAYVIWRNSLLGGLERVGGRDGDTSHTFTDSEATRTFTTFDGFPSSDDIGARAQFTATGLIPGQRYGYQVACGYRNGLEDRNNDGVPDDAEFMSPLSLGSGLVTAIAPPVITAINGETPSSSSQVDLRSFVVQWQQTPGADAYVVWVSTDPQFRKNKIKVKAPKTIPVDQGGPITESVTVNAFKGKFRRADRVFVTVGARNSFDPKPIPFGAIFSAPVGVISENGPPPPPTRSGAAKRK